VDFPDRNLFQFDFLKSLLNHLFKFWVFGAFSLAESEIGLSDFGFFFFLQVVFLSGSSNFLVVWVKEESDKGGAREREKKIIM